MRQCRPLLLATPCFDSAADVIYIDIYNCQMNSAMQPSFSIEMQNLLLDAADKGQTDTVLAWLQSGHDARFFSSEGMTPLMMAARRNRHECVRLLAPFSDFNAKAQGTQGDGESTAFQGATALLTACMFGNLDTVRALLECGANPDIGDSEGCTPMMTCVLFGDKKCMLALLGYGASTLVVDKHGYNVHDIARKLSRSSFDAILCCVEERETLSALIQAPDKIETASTRL